MTAPFYVPPEQLTKERADFARKGIARGRPIAVCGYTDGVLLIGENPSGSLHKLGEVYDRIAFAGVGRFNEFEILRTAGVRYADVKGYSYGRRDVTARGLANAYSQTLGQIFTHELKPYEIEIMVAEIGDEPADTQIFRILFDGTLGTVTHFGAMGGNDAKVGELLVEGWNPDLDLAAAVRLTAGAIEAVDDRTVAPLDWEAAVLDRTRGRRKFRRLTAEDIANARATDVAAAVSPAPEADETEIP
ncbi:MAG: proteasome subunit alpha [Actinomycetota bacterium]|nr:proteasome subunit alpha [Actinomycetota bacterium]